MLSSQVIQTTIDDLKNITKVDFTVVDVVGKVIATTEQMVIEKERIEEFVESKADSQNIGRYHYIKVYDDGEPVYIVICQESKEAYILAKIVVSELQSCKKNINPWYVTSPEYWNSSTVTPLVSN